MSVGDANGFLGRLFDSFLHVDVAERSQAHADLLEILGMGLNVGVHETEEEEPLQGVYVVLSPFRFGGENHPDPAHYRTGKDRPNVVGQNYDLEYVFDRLLQWNHRYRISADHRVQAAVRAFLAYSERLVEWERPTGVLGFELLAEATHGHDADGETEDPIAVYEEFRREFQGQWYTLQESVMDALVGRTARWELWNTLGSAIVVGALLALIVWRYVLLAPPGFLGPKAPSVFLPTAIGIVLLVGWVSEVNLQRRIRGARSLLWLGTAVWLAWLILGPEA